MSEQAEHQTEPTVAPGVGLPRAMAVSLAVTALSADAGRRVLEGSSPEVDYVRFAALVFSAALLFTVGGIFMKLSDGVTRLSPSLMMAVCFVAGAVLQALAMRGGDLGVVYVIVLGVEAVLAMTFGWYFFAEQMSVWKLGGVALIIAGIATLRAGL